MGRPKRKISWWVGIEEPRGMYWIHGLRRWGSLDDAAGHSCVDSYSATTLRAALRKARGAFDAGAQRAILTRPKFRSNGILWGYTPLERTGGKLRSTRRIKERKDV